jgi:hypothetical protein
MAPCECTLPTGAMLLVGAAVAGIAHHLHGARNLREGRAVVLSGDEWDGRSVFKGAATDRSVCW